MDKDETRRQNYDGVDLDELEMEIIKNNFSKVDAFIAALPKQMKVSRKRMEIEMEQHALLKRVTDVISHLHYDDGKTQIHVGHADEFTRCQKGSSVFVYATRGDSASVQFFLMPEDSDDLIEDAVFFACMSLEAQEAVCKLKKDGVRFLPRGEEELEP